MAFFLAPLSGNAVGGVPHPEDAPADSIKEPKSRFGRRKRKYRLDNLPSGQIPGPPPPYAWKVRERADWFPPYSVTEDVPLPGGPPDPGASRRAALVKEADVIRKKIAGLRMDLERELETARAGHERERMQHMSDKGMLKSVKNAPVVGSPLQRQPTIPAQPRATRPFAAMPLRQEWRGPSRPTDVPHGTPLKMHYGSTPAPLNPGTQRILGIRAEISKSRLRLAQIRQQIKQLKQITKPLAPKPAASGTQWTKKSPAHQAEAHHSRFVSRDRGWRSQLKMVR